jgi:hypothetical protein
LDVAERGRLSTDIRQAYSAAHEPPRQRVAPPAEATESDGLERRLSEAEHRLSEADRRLAEAERRIAALESRAEHGAAAVPQRRRRFSRRS